MAIPQNSETIKILFENNPDTPISAGALGQLTDYTASYIGYNFEHLPEKAGTILTCDTVGDPTYSVEPNTRLLLQRGTVISITNEAEDPAHPGIKIIPPNSRYRVFCVGLEDVFLNRNDLDQNPSNPPVNRMWGYNLEYFVFWCDKDDAAGLPITQPGSYSGGGQVLISIKRKDEDGNVEMFPIAQVPGRADAYYSSFDTRIIGGFKTDKLGYIVPSSVWDISGKHREVKATQYSIINEFAVTTDDLDDNGNLIGRHLYRPLRPGDLDTTSSSHNNVFENTVTINGDFIIGGVDPRPGDSLNEPFNNISNRAELRFNSGMLSETPKIFINTTGNKFADRFPSTSDFLSVVPGGMTYEGYYQHRYGNVVFNNGESASKRINSFIIRMPGDDYSLYIDPSNTMGLGVSSPTSRIDIADNGPQWISTTLGGTDYWHKGIRLRDYSTLMLGNGDRTEWLDINTYVVGDEVQRSSQIYTCITENSNKDPVSNPSFWERSTYYGIGSQKNKLYFFDTPTPTSTMGLASHYYMTVSGRDIGVGIVDPTARMHILTEADGVAGLNQNGSSTNDILKLENNRPNLGSVLVMKDAVREWEIGSQSATSGDKAGFYLYNRTDYSNDAEKKRRNFLFFTPDGKIGSGTQDPDVDLQLEKIKDSDLWIKLLNNSEGTAARAGISFHNPPNPSLTGTPDNYTLEEKSEILNKFELGLSGMKYTGSDNHINTTPKDTAFLRTEAGITGGVKIEVKTGGLRIRTSEYSSIMSSTNSGPGRADFVITDPSDDTKGAFVGINMNNYTTGNSLFQVNSGTPWCTLDVRSSEIGSNMTIAQFATDRRDSTTTRIKIGAAASDAGNGWPTKIATIDFDNFISTSISTVSAGSFVIGNAYIILSVGSTNFVSIGASSNTIGASFVATGVGSGSGTATTASGSGVKYTMASVSAGSGIGAGQSTQQKGGLIFSTNDASQSTPVPRMYITSTGRVGIGQDFSIQEPNHSSKADPDYLLDVKGDIGLDQYLWHNDDEDTYLRFNDTNENEAQLVAGGVQALWLRKTSSAISTISVGNTVGSLTKIANINIDLNSIMYLDSVSHKVYIGNEISGIANSGATSPFTPTAELDVAYSTDVKQYIRTTGSDKLSQLVVRGARTAITNDIAAIVFENRINASTNVENAKISSKMEDSSSKSNLIFSTNNGTSDTEAMRITSGQDLSIGFGTLAGPTTAKLSVNGGVNIGDVTDPGDNNLNVVGLTTTNTLLVNSTMTFNDLITSNTKQSDGTHIRFNVETTPNTPKSSLLKFYGVSGDNDATISYLDSTYISATKYVAGQFLLDSLKGTTINSGSSGSFRVMIGDTTNPQLNVSNNTVTAHQNVVFNNSAGSSTFTIKKLGGNTLFHTNAGSGFVGVNMTSKSGFDVGVTGTVYVSGYQNVEGILSVGTYNLNEPTTKFINGVSGETWQAFIVGSTKINKDLNVARNSTFNSDKGSYIFTVNGTSANLISASGTQIGINTASYASGYTLTVNGKVKISDNIWTTASAIIDGTLSVNSATGLSSITNNLQISNSTIMGPTTLASASTRLQVNTSSKNVLFRSYGATNNPGFEFTNTEATKISNINAIGTTNGIMTLSSDGAERIRIANAGPVIISTTALGTTLGSTAEMLSLTSNNGNTGYLEVRQVRDAAGTDWTTAGQRIQSKVDSTYMGWMQFSGGGNQSGIAFGTGSATTSATSIVERMRINSSGDVGIGTIPSASTGGSLFLSQNIVTTNTAFWGGNIYNNSGYKYLAAGLGSTIQHSGGSIIFGRVATGSKDAAATVTQSMMIDTSGNVGINVTSTTYKLQVGGTLQSDSNFSVNTNKFNVTAANGNTAIAGTLDCVGDFKVNTNKLTVAASTGNTVVAGTLQIGSSGTLQYNQSVPTGSTVLGYNGNFYATKVYNAVYNDLAEFMWKSPDSKASAGDVLVATDGGVTTSYKRADVAVVGVYSDSYGFALYQAEEDKKHPVGMTGTLKVKVKGIVKIGDVLVSYKNGYAIRANLFEKLFKRDALIGKVINSKKDSDDRVMILIK